MQTLSALEERVARAARLPWLILFQPQNGEAAQGLSTLPVLRARSLFGTRDVNSAPLFAMIATAKFTTDDLCRKRGLDP